MMCNPGFYLIMKALQKRIGELGHVADFASTSSPLDRA
jgi:hypothetical protein